MKTVSIAVLILVIALLIATPVYLHIGTNQVRTVGDSRTYWRNLAQNAWEYFQPGKGVDAKTGLHGASIDYPYFTDWDLGVYVQTIVDAEKLGIISSGGDWGANAR